MANELQQIQEKIESMQTEINAIKKQIVDVDVMMTDDDKESLELADEDFKKGRTKRLR